MKRALTLLLLAASLSLPPTTLASYATIRLEPGLNMISIHIPGDIGQWLQEIGFGNGIDRAIAWDAQAQELVVLTPADSPPASFAMAGDEGIVVHATAAKEVTVWTVACTDFQFRQGVNLVALACQGPNYSAFDLLDFLGSASASSIQRYNPENGAFETAAFNAEGELTGIDFAIAPGEGYFLFMRQAVSALDTDADGILDADESSYGTAVDDPDSDDDGLLDGLEVNVHGTNPLLEDTDEDTFSDAVEVAWGTSPLDLADTPPVHDPQEVVTPIDPTVATTLFDASRFLYSGDAPIQTGMDPALIEPQRAAVLRGQVRDRTGRAVSGATVTILNHAEYGQTLTRHDGWFDLVVNGGKPLTIRLQKEGYLPLQRDLDVPWRDYVIAPEMVMMAPDPVVTAVDLDSTDPIQVVRSSVVSDADGTRQATLLIEQGTGAELVMPDGSTQPLTNLSVRATEYTVGEDGAEAMPAILPPASAYTYCVELSVDEAAAAGAADVRFDKPVYHYVEDFIGFPVGSDVPVGYYDDERGVWVASENGKVIQILGITGGLADLDTNGDDAVDDAATLAALNVTDAERENLAALYAAGQRLWRVPVQHFSAWDCNWG